jgi:membrane dipeptidase
MAAMGAVAAAGYLMPAQARENTPLRWAPYEGVIAIDGAGGLGRVDDNKDGTLSQANLDDARGCGVTAILCTIAPSGRFWFGEEGHQNTLHELDRQDSFLAQFPDYFAPIRSGADLPRAHRDKRLGLIYGFQDTSPLGEDIDRVDLYYRRGVRVIQMTHNRRNLVGDGCMEPGNAGLSNFGHDVIAKLNERRVIVDCAHGGRRTTLEAIKASKRPVLLSHTGCAAISDVPRCMPDEVLREMANRGGVAGIVFWPYLRRHGQPTSDDLIQHIEHAIDVCGEDHVGLGTDSSVSKIDRTPEYEAATREWVKGMVEIGFFEEGARYPFIEDLNHLRRFETLGALLARRGHSESRIAKVLGGNFARVMQEVWG